MHGFSSHDIILEKDTLIISIVIKSWLQEHSTVQTSENYSMTSIKVGMSMFTFFEHLHLLAYPYIEHVYITVTCKDRINETCTVNMLLNNLYGK